MHRMVNRFEGVSNEVVLLGAAMQQTEDGRLIQSQAGTERADRFIQYYLANKRAFEAQDAFVLCTGGYALIANGMEAPAEDAREGLVTADYLVQNNVPHQIIRTESESTSTVTNITNSIEEGLILPSLYNEDRKLGVLSHPGHLLRADVILGKVDIPKEARVLIATYEKDSAFREFIFRTVYRALLIGAHGPEQLNKREQLPKNVLALVRGALKGQQKVEA